MSFLASATPFDDVDDNDFFVGFDEDNDNDTNIYTVPLSDKDAENTVMTSTTIRGTLESFQEEHDGQHGFTQRSSPPRSPLVAKSALKLYKTEDIPVCTKRRAWKILPAPDMKQIQTSNMTRVESMASFFHQEPSPLPTLKKSSSKVSFHDVTIREYDLTLGDNPSVSYGPPISLDWNYSEKQALDLDLYEGNRPQRRSMSQMNLNYYQRKHTLTMYGYTDEEIKQAKKDASKVKNQRAVTRQLLAFQKVEDALESASRKAKRIIKGGGEGTKVDALAQSLPGTSGEKKAGGLTKRCMSAPVLAELVQRAG